MRTYDFPLQRKRDAFRSLVKALDGHFDKPFKDLPPRAKVRVLRDFGLDWDRLGAARRKDCAAQWDDKHDPAKEQERKFWWDFYIRKREIEEQIETWKMVATPTASDLAKKESRVAELQKELAAMKRQERTDASPTTDASIAQSTKEETDDFKRTLLNTAYELVVDAKSTSVHPGSLESPCAVFRNMQNLTADELSISFVGDKSESGMGANNMLEISARGVTKRAPVSALCLVNRTQGTLNGEGATLLGMAGKKSPQRNHANSQKIKRLRKVFRTCLGVTGDSFERYRSGAGWMPLFTLADKRGAADERAKREGYLRTASYEQMIHTGSAAGVHTFDEENDDADAWMKNRTSDQG